MALGQPLGRGLGGAQRPAVQGGFDQAGDLVLALGGVDAGGDQALQQRDIGMR